MDPKTDRTFTWLHLIKSVYYLVGEHSLKFTGLLIFLITLQFNSILTPLILGKIVDFFTNYIPGDSLNTFYIYVAIIGGLQVVVSYLRLSTKKAIGLMTTIISFNTRVRGFKKLMELSLAWHDSEVTGNKFQRIQNGTQQLRSMLRLINNEVFNALVSLVGMIIVFAFMQPIYIIVVIFYVAVFSWMLKYFYDQTIDLQDQQNIAIENASGSYVEGLGNILSIKASGVQKNFTQSVSVTENIRKEFEQKLMKVNVQKWQMYQAFNGVVMSVFLVLIGHDVVSGVISVGSILIVYNYVQQLITRSGDILDVYQQLIECKSAIGRMMNILSSNDIPKGGTKKFPKTWEQIRLSHISFSYPKSTKSSYNTQSLKDVSLTIHKNQKIGIVGKTGSGKSTIAKVLLGLYPIDSGEYLIGNQPFSDTSHESLTNHMAMVLQDSEMFNMTIKDNITLLRNIPEETLIKSIKIAQLESVIAKLPLGIDTIIGEKGYHLSGGERQRVGIARAICQDPEIIIFDEATSSLDSQTESKIQNALEKSLNHKTLIFIAHRISTLKNADMIYVFQNGEIVESGSYHTLLKKKKSLFNALYTTQENKQKAGP